MSDYVLKLSKPNSAHGEVITSLTFRAPTGKDVFEAGYPYKWQSDSRSPTVVTRMIDVPCARALLSKMASVPTSTIDSLGFSDFSDALGVISYFLVEPTQNSSSAIASLSASSGETSSGASA